MQSTVHIVGDNTGWSVPSSPNFYSQWAAGKTFRVGDSLQFNFPANAHNVHEMETKQSFDACNFVNSDNDVERTSPVIERLDELGMHYFVCTVGTHCSNGQKLSINVVAANATVSMPPPSSSPPSSVMPPPVMPPPSPS
nr:Chain A, Cucumber Stellacyanin [Cucumis sativus]